MNKNKEVPNNLDEAIKFLEAFYFEDISEIKKMNEIEFNSSSHFGLGMYLRNIWFLWWSPNHGYDSWPKEKPKIVEYFNAIDIYHADDMSGIILTSFFRKIKGLDINIPEQVKKYKIHWLKQGYKGGIPLEKNL